MTGNEIRKKYLDYMEARKHAVVPSAALVPENDPTTLFTGSGMQPLVPYLLGEKHPKGTRITNSQKCFRSNDIEEVGDNRHTTFFEMMGNWSLGDYFKAEQLPWFFGFLTDEVGLDPNRLYVTCFIGDVDSNVPRDTESEEIWKRLFAAKQIKAKVANIGSEEAGYARGMKEEERIFYYDGDKNWWSRAGAPRNMPVGEPGGPDSEVFYEFTDVEHDPKWGEYCHPNCDCGRFLEIGNSVFMEYIKTETGFEKLPRQNVDFGGGLERIAAAAIDSPDMFNVDLLRTVVDQLEALSGKSYENNLEAFRVITDHIRGAVFLIGDGVLPSNADQGYFVRRLLRRSVRYADMIGIPAGEFKNLANSVIETYQEHYQNLATEESKIIEAIGHEEDQFRKTLEKGLKQFNKIGMKVSVPAIEVDGKIVKDTSKDVTQSKFITGQNAFELFTTYGFPIELTEEIAAERGMAVKLDEFEKLMEEHRQRSRAGAEHKFKGGLADHSDKVVQYHSVTHLLLAGLRKELGEDVHQAGSNITGERLRFDFTHGEKVERDVLDKVEEYVNNAIKTGGEVTTEMMAKDAAQADETIEASFWDRYPDEVKVYTMTGDDGTVFSRELCGGPHVEKLSDIQGNFKITKEESTAAGVRRVKAILE